MPCRPVVHRHGFCAEIDRLEIAEESFDDASLWIEAGRLAACKIARKAYLFGDKYLFFYSAEPTACAI
jgi:hypothetical protein